MIHEFCEMNEKYKTTSLNPYCHVVITHRQFIIINLRYDAARTLFPPAGASPAPALASL